MADEIIVKNAIFKDIGNDNFDNEVNRLLILVAVVTRQLLRSYSNFDNNFCGSFYHNYPVEKTPKKLTFEKACSMIIHATNIDIQSQDYYYSEADYNEAISKKPEKAKYRYYQGIITVVGEKKERAELNFEEFAKYCIELSNKAKGE
ncbi:hypothetical protein SPONN_35 [uncultured Candidatus Thioglobus sp.]|nr:hypothetical protein SPONN_35 [uncultured Candidatus Thioglobus sp.]